MHKDYRHDPQLSISSGYEVSDVNTRVILTFGILVAIVAIVALPVTVMIIRTLQDTRPPVSPRPVSPLTGQVHHAPTGPLLQTEPGEERRGAMGAAAARLNSYGIVVDDPQDRRAHVPIERALELLAEGRLAYRQTPEDSAAPTAPEPVIEQPAPETDAPVPVPAPRREPVAPAPPAVPAPEPLPEPESVVDPEPEPEPVVEQEPAPAIEEAPEAAPLPEPEPEAAEPETEAPNTVYQLD